MADLSITAANVSAVDGAVSKSEFVAGATVTAGCLVYVDTAASNVLKLAQADGTAAEAVLKGIAMNGGSTGQPIYVAVAGDLNPGATVAVGTVYAMSAAAGKICPVADLTTGDYVSLLGVATTTTNLKLNIFNSGVEKA